MPSQAAQPTTLAGKKGINKGFTHLLIINILKDFNHRDVLQILFIILNSVILKINNIFNNIFNNLNLKIILSY